MNMMIMATFAVALTASAQTVTSRVGVADGDVSLQGPLAKTFEAMYRNHVLEQDPVYLTECFKDRTETGLWQTEFWGKYMHSAAPFWSMTKDPVLKSRLDAGIANLLPSQQANGYLGNYAESRRSARGTWDVWGIKYTMMGLLHYYDATGHKSSLEACKKLCDYLIGSVGTSAKLTIGGTGNYSGMPSCSVLEPVVWLYRRTKDQKYLDFADFIVKEMIERKDGPRLLDLTSLPVSERSPALRSGNALWEDFIKSRSKAYEMMSCYQGLLEYYEVTGRKELLGAAVASAASMIRDEINLAGGAAMHEIWFHGKDHQHEPYSRLQETCVTITWMRLCEKLLAITGEPVYADQFERTFYNAYLAALSRDGSIFAAYTPLTGYRSEGHLHCRMHTNCCNANGPRGFLAFLRSILQAKDNEVFLNWYASGIASVTIPSLGEKARFEIHTLYPRDGKVDIRFRLDKPMKFKFSVRIPGCTAGNKMTVNGSKVEARYLEGPRYTMHERIWKPGDVVTLDFGMPVKAHVLHDHVAFTRGPVLLARDSRFNDGDLSAEFRRRSLDVGRLPAFEHESGMMPDEMRLVVSAALPVGGHDENPEGARQTRVHFCDYASAGNLWRPGNSYRTFFPLDFGPETFAELGSAKDKKPTHRMDRTKLNIGTYCLKPYARTEEHIKDLAACGIDFVIENLDRKTLDLCAKHKIGVFLGGVTPWWWGGYNNDRNGRMREINPLWQYDAAAKRFKDHPAVWAIDIGDEPSALDFPYYGEVVRNTVANYPNQFPYLNLYPNYALPGKDGQDLSKTQLGSKDYRTHIESYCKNVPLDYISYDHYPWGWKNKVPAMFENLRIVAAACTATRRSLWIVLQANTYAEGKKRNRAMSIDMLRYQANTALAYGAEVLSWACWTKGWWDDNAVDTNGVKTATYDMLKTVNAELHRLSPEYMKLRRLNTDLVGFDAAFAAKVLQPVLAASSGAGFSDVKAADGAALAVGHFASRDGSGGYAMFIAACDDAEGAAPKVYEILFRPASAKNAVKAFGPKGAVSLTKKPDGTMTVPLRSCDGVLVVSE